MRRSRIAQRDPVTDMRLDFAGAQPREQIRGARGQVLAAFDVVEQHGPRCEQRTARCEVGELEVRDHSRRLAEVYEHAAQPQTFARPAPRVLPHRIVNHVATLRPGDLLDARHEIFRAIVDHMGISARPGDGSLSGEPAVPMDVAPSAFNHWPSRSPTPPAAACTSTVSPALTG